MQKPGSACMFADIARTRAGVGERDSVPMVTNFNFDGPVPRLRRASTTTKVFSRMEPTSPGPLVEEGYE